MSVTTHTCVVASCDNGERCPSYDHDDVWTPHFTTTAEAIATLTGESYRFTFGPAGVFCRICSCQRAGHVWSDWDTRCYAPPGRPSFCHTRRECLRCELTETRRVDHTPEQHARPRITG